MKPNGVCWVLLMPESFAVTDRILNLGALDPSSLFGSRQAFSAEGWLQQKQVFFDWFC